MRAAEFIEALRLALMWNPSTLATKISNCYADHLLNRLENAFAVMDSADCAACGRARLMLGSFSRSMQLEFLGSPYIAALVLQPEALRQKAWREVFESALTKYAAYHEALDVGTCAKPRPLQVTALAVNTTFEIGLPLPRMSRGGQRFYEIRDRARTMTAQRLLSAGRLIRTATEVQAFVEQNTKLLVLLGESDEPSRFSSGSFRILPGLHLVFNPHIRSASRLALADAMIHEAIHCAIYRYEAVGECIIGINGKEHVAQSPWTQTMLPLDSFAQACLVWFGLYNFWKAQTPGIHGARVYRDRAACGLRSSRFRELIIQNERFMAANVAPALLSLAESI